MYNNNVNSGYVGYSRSVRSSNAIDNYEVPLSHINKQLINEVSLYLNIDLTTLKIGNFKKYLKDNELATSWHHTSRCFNETDHYNIIDIFEDMPENELKTLLNNINNNYKVIKPLKKELNKNYKIVIIEVTELIKKGKNYKTNIFKDTCILNINNKWIKSIYNNKRYNADAKKNTIIKTLNKKDITKDIKVLIKSKKLLLKNMI